MRYTAIAIQPEHYSVWERSTLQKNLDHHLKLIDFVCTSSGTTTAKSKGKAYAPIKLIVFPEFFLTGTTSVADINKYKKDILINIPGNETEQLSKKAKEYNIFICGAALERVEHWDNVFFNCAFIIGPCGNVIHKYHKLYPAIQWEMSASPHDVYDEYIKIFGKNKSLLQTFFPVVKTEIGNLGTFICMDGHFPELARCLTLNGAEVLLRPTAFPEPIVYEPNNWWEIQNRARALENLAYVVAANTGVRKGGLDSHEECYGIRPRNFLPGDSMVVNYEGQIVGRTQYPGETICFGVIDLDGLRDRRRESARNFPTLLRTEPLHEAYKKSIYPPNLYQRIEWTKSSELMKRSPENIGLINDFIKNGIYK